MNRKEYNSDPRYKKVLEQMDLLGIMDVTTTRQSKNGTIIWKLPIKMYGKLIEVGSFKSGYVRRMNGGYTPYQLNKRNYYDHYYKSYDGKWIDGEYVQKWNGKYNKMTCRGCIYIPNEIDRLEYLISYCLKNYYIKQANMIEDGKFVPKWKYEYELERQKDKSCSELADFRCEWEKELQNKIQDLELELQDARDDYQDLSYRFDETTMELDNTKCGWINDLSITVNGERYKIK